MNGGKQGARSIRALALVHFPCPHTSIARPKPNEEASAD